MTGGGIFALAKVANYNKFIILVETIYTIYITNIKVEINTLRTGSRSEFFFSKKWIQHEMLAYGGSGSETLL